MGWYEYIAALSAKLRYLAGHANEIVSKRKREISIFTDWPVTLFLVETFLVNYGRKVLSIRSAHKANERATARDKSNDPSDPS